VKLLNQLTRFLVIVLVIILTASSAFTEEVIDSICAVVDEEIILESEISYGVYTMLLETGTRYPTPEMLAELRSQVLEAYITQKILFARAVEETITVETRIVDKELIRKLDNLIQQIGTKEKLEEYFGRPMRQIKREMRKGVRDGMLIEKLKQQHMMSAHVNRSEVIDFYREYRDELPKQQESVVLSHILLEILPSEEARECAEERIDFIYRLLMDGADFDSVASEYSDDPSKSNCGKLGFTERNDLVPEYEEVAYELEEGAISEVVESRYGFHIIRLIDRQGEKISTQHILVKLSPTAEDKQLVMDEALKLKTMIDSDEDFAEMARLYSADSETAEKGGQLDRMTFAGLPLDFRNVIETMNEGEVSVPFETSFGIHILKLDEKTPERVISLDDDWQTIEQFAMMKKQEKMFKKWVDELSQEHYIWP